MHVMVTDASPSQNALSTINGICHVFTILPQALAPATATVLFAYSIKSQIVGGQLIWVVLFTITCVGALHSLTLKEATHNWRNQTRDM
ncbi:hypothetical protein Clacol_009539 [Clathrus columnatus]|uniref:Uncharacterized protein n=1 Tax=Clathrus columnatus TaxID=1419009 RepID=A0AAV5AQE7_9AGAM|nr:hypothetical protein Clacol_009539 [Clathrus columnatus]